MSKSSDPSASFVWVSQIRAVTIDLDDTLWPVGPVIANAEHALRDWLCVHAPLAGAIWRDAERLRTLRTQVWKECADAPHHLTHFRQTLIRRALEQTGEDLALAPAAFAAFFAQRQRVQLYGDALEALAFFSSRVPVVALSNGNADVMSMEIGRFFHAALSAERVGVGKPDAAIFLEGARVAGHLPPAQVLHIGDDPELDARGAMDAGMHAVWLNRTDVDWPYAELTAPPTVRSLSQLCRCWQAAEAMA